MVHLGIKNVCLQASIASKSEAIRQVSKLLAGAATLRRFM